MEAILKELQEIKRLLALQKKILNMDEFCIYTGISKPYAYHLTSTGKVKFYRPFGKMIYFDVEDVVEFLKQNAAETSLVKSKANKYFIDQLNK